LNENLKTAPFNWPDCAFRPSADLKVTYVCSVRDCNSRIDFEKATARDHKCMAGCRMIVGAEAYRVLCLWRRQLSNSVDKIYGCRTCTAYTSALCIRIA